jgi:hypothetical protein
VRNDDRYTEFSGELLQAFTRLVIGIDISQSRSCA